jgi:hypothetical protein
VRECGEPGGAVECVMPANQRFRRRISHAGGALSSTLRSVARCCIWLQGLARRADLRLSGALTLGWLGGFDPTRPHTEA